jgi:hypothetical protein
LDMLAAACGIALLDALWAIIAIYDWVKQEQKITKQYLSIGC